MALMCVSVLIVAEALAAGLDPRVAVHKVDYKITEITPDFTHIAFKADVTCIGESGRAYIELRGFDGDGFPTARIVMGGDCASDRRAVISTITMVRNKIYEGIKEWKVSETNLHQGK